MSMLERLVDAPAVRLLALAGALGLAGWSYATSPPVANLAPPARLSQTGLYADGATRALAPGVLPYEPQYPLWTDGAVKRRWIRLPPETAIDASDPEAWEFPIGTRLWKEFAFGRRVETRLLERGADGAWIYASYVWTEDGGDALLAPDRGLRGACEVAPGVRHDIPGTADCRVCHESARSPVLGFTALQLSPDRDPLAPHAVRPAPGSLDLDGLLRRKLVRGLPRELRAPRIEAPTPRGRAALGYLAANCGMCHNDVGPLAALGLSFDVPLDDAARPLPGLATTLERASLFRGAEAGLRIVPGDPDASTLVQRMAARATSAQMPPLGTHLADDDALALLRAWIRDDLAPRTVARR